MYCTVTDIETYYLNKSFDNDEDQYVSNSDVDAFIAAESSMIDAILSMRYSLPITNTNDLRILKSICEKLVVGTVDDILRDRDNDGKFTRQRDTRKEANLWLDMIKDGKMRLNSTQKSSPIFFNKTDSNGNDVEKRFKDSNIEPKVISSDTERSI